MDWIYDKPPKDYEEVIICSTEGKVRSAIYLGKGKWNTFLQVACWQPFPKAPENLNEDEEDTTPVKKKRGRPKKV